MNQEEIKNCVTGFFQSVQLVAHYMNDRVKPLLDGLIQLGNREATLKGLFLRALCWMRSIEKLNHPTDFQALVTANRSFLEILIDMILIHHDKTDGTVNKIKAWEESAKLKAAQCISAYYQKQNQPVSKHFKPFIEKYIKNKQKGIRQKRPLYWPNYKGKHPERWTGCNLDHDARKCDKLEKVSLEEFYETRCRELCWNIHGSGLAGVRNLLDYHFGIWAGLSYDACANFAVLCSRIILRDFGLIKYHPDLKTELEKLEEQRKILWAKAMKILPEEDLTES